MSNSIAAQIIQGAAAQRSGSDVGAAVSGADPSNTATSMNGIRVVADEEVAFSGEEDTSPLLPAGMQDSPAEETSADQDEEKADPASREASDGKPTADKGTRRKLAVDKGKNFIEVDYSNREAIDKAYLLAHGARKWQSERDQARKELDTIRQSHEPLKKHWDTLESAYRDKGVEGVIDLLEGGPGSYQKHIQGYLHRQEFLRTASPEQKAAFEAQEAARAHQKELEKIRKENEDFRTQMQQQRDETEMRQLESQIHPTFNKYRFTGKLGDADREHVLDEMLWNTALRRLEPYEEKGLEITPELIESEFRKVASAVRSTVSKTADKVASRVVEKKKQTATEHAQAAVRSGMGSTASNTAKAKEAMGLIESGNLTSLIKGWNTSGFGKLFSK